MLKLACQEQLLPGDDLVAKFDFARRAGFDGIELRAKGTITSRVACPSCGPPSARAW